MLVLTVDAMCFFFSFLLSCMVLFLPEMMYVQHRRATAKQ